MAYHRLSDGLAMPKRKMINTGGSVNHFTRVILLAASVACGIVAFVFGGVEYVVVVMLGISMLLVKDFIFWRGSGEKLSFRSYILGDMPEPSGPGRAKSGGRSHSVNRRRGLFAKFGKRRKKA
jgi:hypothetical protein